MIHIKGLDLESVTPFKNLSVDFENGLTYIRGVNKDSDLAQPTGNGAGKSRFFSAIANVLYSSAPLSLRKKARKDMLARKGSSIGLILQPGEDSSEYEIIQTSGKYTIYKDGKDIEITTIPRAEAFVRGLFPLSEVEFYSRCYISTQRPYALLRDSDSDRLQHIIDIAQLDQYSALQKYFALQASDIKDNEIRLSVLEQQALNLKRKLKKVKATATKEQYAALKSEYAEYTSQLEKLQAEKFILLEQQKALNKLFTVEEDLDKLRKSYTFKKPPSEQLVLLKREKKAAQAWASYDEKKAHADKMRTKFDKRIAEIEDALPKTGNGELRKTFKTLSQDHAVVIEQLAKFEGLAEQATSLDDELNEMQSKFDALDVNPSDIDLDKNYDEHIAEAKLRLKLEALLDHEEADEESGKCPTCQSDIDFEAIRKIVKGERKALALYQTQKKAQTLYSELRALKKKRSKLNFNPEEFRKLKARKKQIAKTLEQTEEVLGQLDELESLIKQRKDIELPTKPESSKPALSIDDLEASIELCYEIEKYLNVKASLLKDHQEFKAFRSADSVKDAVQELTSALDDKNRAIRRIESKQATCSEGIAAYEQYVNTVNVYKGEQKTVDAEIAKLRPSVQNKKLITLLTKAYGTKGLRTQAANAFCTMLQTNLNHYRDLIFAEPFEFIVESSDTGVAIMVDRNNGKPDSVSDVRHLSGAESECFALLCAASLITLTPDSRRLNIMVLDEPTSHLHPVSKDLFTSKFLPFLLELVPSVFIIDNTDDPMYKESCQWTVEKRKGVSKLLAHA